MIMEIVKIILVGGLSGITILSGVFKLTKNKKVTESLSLAGVGKYIPYLGLAEIIFALLFLYPPTRNIGFILLVCYFSGAMAADIPHNRAVTTPLVLLVLLFATAYINNAALFF